MPHALVIGNSDGIGLALTRALVADGWDVTGVSRSASPVDARGYSHHVVNVCDPQYSTRLSEVVSEVAGRSVCVYCVGIGEYLDLDTLAAERQVFETNLVMVSAAQAAQRIQRCMQKRPIRDTFPKRMAALLWLVRMHASLRRWFI